MLTARTPVAIVSCLALALIDPVTAHADLVFFVESGFGDTVSSFDTTDDTSSTLSSHPQADPSSIALDHDNRRVYYSYGTTIASVGFDGSGREDILAAGTGISALEFDSSNGHLYFATTSGSLGERAIKRVGTDGSGLTTIHSHDSLSDDPFITTSEIHNLIVDGERSRLYWTADDGGVAGRVGLNFSTLTGSGVGQLWKATGRGDAIRKLDIDLDGEKLYYTVGSTTDEVRRSNLDNSSLETLVSDIGEPYAFDADFANERLNFVVGGTLYQGDLDGSDLESYTLGTNSNFAVRDIKVSATAIPEPATASVLLVSGGCVLIWRRRRNCRRARKSSAAM